MANNKRAAMVTSASRGIRVLVKKKRALPCLADQQSSQQGPH